jgi:hypothetical protein
MKNKTPSTIADLKFNFVFTNYETESLTDKEVRFKKQNKSLLKYKIQYREYKFLVNDVRSFYTYGSSIESFIESINYKLNFLGAENFLPKKLTRFELVEENTFRIILEEVKKQLKK